VLSFRPGSNPSHLGLMNMTRAAANNITPVVEGASPSPPKILKAQQRLVGRFAVVAYRYQTCRRQHVPYT
jgi:hypothetical protein